MASYVEDWNAWMWMSQTSPSLRSVMTANGDAAKPIWLTEFGAPTGGPKALADLSSYITIKNSDHVSEELEAKILTDAYVTNKQYSWSGPLFWYSYKDLGTSQSTNENFFGIIRSDGSKKQAYTDLYNMLHN